MSTPVVFLVDVALWHTVMKENTSMPKKRRPSLPSRRRRPSPPQSPLDKLMDQLYGKAADAIDALADHLTQQYTGQPPPPRPRPHTPPPPRQSRPNATRPRHIPTLYDVLQISSHADAETITAAYRSLAKRFHPDNLQTGSKVRMQEIVAAYEVLSNVTRRKIYDRTIGL